MYQAFCLCIHSCCPRFHSFPLHVSINAAIFAGVFFISRCIFQSLQMGCTDHEAARILIDYFKLPITVDDYINFTSEGYVKHFPSSKLMPGMFLIL